MYKDAGQNTDNRRGLQKQPRFFDWAVNRNIENVV